MSLQCRVAYLFLVSLFTFDSKQPDHLQMNILLTLLLRNGILVKLIFSLLMKQLLLLVGAKLEHIITRLGQDSVADTQMKPSDEYFWFGRPGVVLHLLHFTVFQNSFEIAFLFWIWVIVHTLNLPFKSTPNIIFNCIFYSQRKPIQK